MAQKSKSLQGTRGLRVALIVNSDYNWSMTIGQTDTDMQILSTVNGLIFMGYQFSWFSWRVRSSNYSTHEIAI